MALPLASVCVRCLLGRFQKGPLPIIVQKVHKVLMIFRRIAAGEAGVARRSRRVRRPNAWRVRVDGALRKGSIHHHNGGKERPYRLA